MQGMLGGRVSVSEWTAHRIPRGNERCREPLEILVERPGQAHDLVVWCYRCQWRSKPLGNVLNLPDVLKMQREHDRKPAEGRSRWVHW